MRDFALAYVENIPSKQQLKTYLLKNTLKLRSKCKKTRCNNLIDIVLSDLRKK